MNPYQIMVQFESNKRIHNRFMAKNSVPENYVDETKKMLESIPEKKREFLAR